MLDALEEAIEEQAQAPHTPEPAAIRDYHRADERFHRLIAEHADSAAVAGLRRAGRARATFRVFVGVGVKDAEYALDAGIDAVIRLGGAKPGDKTMVDAAAPFRETLAEAFDGDAGPAITTAAGVAREAADKTADIAARLGRARVLGEKASAPHGPGCAVLLAADGCPGRPSDPLNKTRKKERTMALRIVVGGDNAGFSYKEALRKDLESDERVESVQDVGVMGTEDDTSYPNVAIAAAEKIAAGEAGRALLICGTGLGVAISANKVKGI